MRRIKAPRGGRRAALAAVTTLALITVLASCAGDDQAADDGAPAATEPSTTTSPDDAWQPPPCEPETTDAPDVVQVDGSTSDYDLTSFDGTVIRVHWFPLDGAIDDEPAPTVLMGPGWGLPGDSNPDAVGVFGALNIATLHDEGFNVLTWDPRGFGQSSGTATVNSVDAEGRDVQALLDWVATWPGVELDAPGDPRAGMLGGSYGGGIQLTTAAIDCRVDALVPIVAWHSLETSLYKAQTPKTGWSNILIVVAGSESVDPHTVSANDSANETGVIAEDDIAWFVERGPGDLVDEIRAPTLFLHGTVDTLFTLDEAFTNFEIVRDNGVPAAMVWFCGGHGTCLTSEGDTHRIGDAAITWLQRWLFDDPSIDTGPAIEIIDQNGERYTITDFPFPTTEPITASGSGELDLVADGGSGPPADPPEASTDLLRSLTLPITPAPAANAVDVAVAVPDEPVLVVGAPELTFTYRGTAPDDGRPARVFAQLVDDATGLVIGNQITPIEVILDGDRHSVDVPLEIVSFATTPGSGVTLQLVATTVAYARPRLGGTITFESIDVALPVLDGLTPVQP